MANPEEMGSRVFVMCNFRTRPIARGDGWALTFGGKKGGVS